MKREKQRTARLHTITRSPCEKTMRHFYTEAERAENSKLLNLSQPIRQLTPTLGQSQAFSDAPQFLLKRKSPLLESLFLIVKIFILYLTTAEFQMSDFI